MKFFKNDNDMFGTPKEYYFCCEYSQDKNKTLRKFQH